MRKQFFSPAGKRLTALMSNAISSEDQFPEFPPLPPPFSPPPLEAPFDDCSTIRRFSSSCREFSFDTAAKNTVFFASASWESFAHDMRQFYQTTSMSPKDQTCTFSNAAFNSTSCSAPSISHSLSTSAM